MKTTLTAFIGALLLFSIMGTAQVVTLSQPIDFTGSQPKDSFSIMIENTDTVSHSFYPLTVFDSPGNYLFVNEDSYFDYLRASGTQIGALRAHANIVKSFRFSNDWLESNDLDVASGLFDKSLSDKRYSTIGFLLGSSKYQCGHYRSFANSALVRSGIFSEDSIWEISLDNHQTSQLIMDGDTAHYDTDPGQGFLLDTLPGGDFMSAADVYASSQYLKPYVACDPIIGCNALRPEHTASHYKSFFGIQTASIPHNLDPVAVSGIWKLCTGCSIEWKWKMPTYKIDTSLLVNHMVADSVQEFLSVGDVNSALVVISNNVTGSVTEAIRMMRDQDFILSNGEKMGDVVTDNCYKKEIELTVHISPRNKPIHIGTEFAVPFAIRSVTTDKPIQIGDTIFPIGTSVIPRYNQKNDYDEYTDDETTPYITGRQFQWVQSGMIPANTTVDFVLFYNQLIYAIPNGIRVETFGDNMNGVVVTQYPAVPTGIREIVDQSWKLEPIEYFTITWQKSVPPLTNGVYIKKQGNHYEKIIVVR